MASPCKGCEERELGCHSYCIAYKQWKAKHSEITIQMHEDKRVGKEMEARLHKKIWG